jgi:signal transduction histidine kinase
LIAHKEVSKVAFLRARQEAVLVIFSFLLFFAVLDTINNYVGSRGEGLPVNRVVIYYYGAIFWAPFFIAVPGVLLLVDHFPIESWRSGWSLFVQAIAGLVFTYLAISFNSIVFAYVEKRTVFPKFFEVLRYDFAVDYLGYCGMAAAGYALQHYLEVARRRQRLRQLEADLAHMNRVSMMGELAASIAHELNQPLSGVVVNGNACLRWLAADSPNVEEARENARRIVRDGKRAGDIVGRIRALATKTAPAMARLDMNETIQEVIALTQTEVRRNSVTLRTELANDLSPVLGDRVQLQQVVLNLVMNAVEAMSTVGERQRELVIRTQDDEDNLVRITVQDSGIGLDPQSLERIFDAFYSTKSGGMGMGLSICRSIVQNHGGRLWAVANDGPGTTLQFTVQKYDIAARKAVAGA